MVNARYYIVNGITGVRVIAFPFLMWFVYLDRLDLFKWLLGICFLTDMIDGFLARKWNVATVFGTRLDSVGDDLSVLAGVVGLWFFKRDFLHEQQFWIYLMLGLFLIQTLMALKRYGRITSFHTYLAKIAALLQGCFLLLLFFTQQPVYPLFATLVLVTTLELIEEIILVVYLKGWRANVKGLFWVLKNR